MNCELCQIDLEAYREGRLPDGIRVQVKAHLEGCKSCAEIYNMENLAERVMEEEKGLQSNPFLSTRIMAGIEELEQKRESYQRVPVYQKVFKPVLIAVSIGVAIFIGVITGSIYKPSVSTNEVPVELSYMNDAALESVNAFANN
jgi:predicted anti-sigma-YlaC factor YlaD